MENDENVGKANCYRFALSRWKVNILIHRSIHFEKICGGEINYFVYCGVITWIYLKHQRLTELKLQQISENFWDKNVISFCLKIFISHVRFSKVRILTWYLLFDTSTYILVIDMAWGI